MGAHKLSRMQSKILSTGHGLKSQGIAFIPVQICSLCDGSERRISCPIRAQSKGIEWISMVMIGVFFVQVVGRKPAICTQSRSRCERFSIRGCSSMVEFQPSKRRCIHKSKRIFTQVSPLFLADHRGKSHKNLTSCPIRAQYLHASRPSLKRLRLQRISLLLCCT